MEMEAAPRPDHLARRAFVATSGVLMAVALACCAWFGASILLLTFAGILFAILLRTPAEWMHRRLKIPSSVAVVLVILILLGSAAGVGWLIAPSLDDQVAKVKVELPKAVDRAGEWLGKTWIGKILRDGDPGARIEWASMLGRAAGVLSSLAGILLGVTIFVFVGIFLAVNPEVYRDGLLRLVPPARRDRARSILEELGRRLRRWLFGRLIGMAFIGLAVGTGLWIVKAPLALSLGLIAALFSFIPNLGPFLGAAPGILLATTQGGTQVAMVVGVYVIVEALDNNIITPLIEQKAVYQPPALTIVSQVVAGLFFGMLGLFLATPLTSTAVLLVRRLYVEDVLGDRPAEEPTLKNP
jgi:predicted PurR-regulated permease PerM